MSDPARRSHWIPRTRDGRVASAAFLGIFLLAMPPSTHVLLNRAEPSFLGVPFLFVALFWIYVALVLVLIWSFRRGV